MLWYLPWSESIKKRACRYLLLRYLGNFLEEKLTLDQLSVDLYNGTGTVCDVSLDCEALNDLGDSQNWPLEIVDGHMKEITVTIPWSTLLKDDSVVVVSGLSITVQPKVRSEPASSMLESMWSSMSSSMQLAAECLREEDGPQEAHPVEGIEMFAHAIDSILSRVKVRFVDTKVRIEHVPKNGGKGIALEIHIKNIDYCDEAGTEPTPDVTDPEKPKSYIVATYTNKKIRFSGVTLYTDEFPSKLRTMARSLIMEKSSSSQMEKTETSPLEQSDINYQSTTSDVFYETRSVISTIESDPIKELCGDDKSHNEIRGVTPEERANQPDPILFAKLTGEQELSLKLKHSSEVEGPKVEVKMLLGSLIVFFSPRQLYTIIELVDALNQPDLEDTSNIPLRPGGNMQCKPMKQADFQLIEAQLLGNLERENVRQPTAMFGWSGPNYEDAEADNEKFLPMSSGQQMTESVSSSVSSMSASVSSSVHIQPKMKRNKKVPHIDGDPTAEVSHISFRVASLSCVLIHRDILIPTALSSDCITPQSANNMQQISKEFFENYEQFSIANGGSKDLCNLNEVCDKSTVKNHLRLIATEVTLDGSEKVTAAGRHTAAEAAVRRARLREVRYARRADALAADGFDVVKFHCQEEDDPASKKSSSSTPRPHVKVNFTQSSKYVRVAGEKKLAYPTTDVVVKCTPFDVDIDLTLIERTNATFFPDATTKNATQVAAPRSQVNFSLLCPELNAVLRFPIADLRPGATREFRRTRPDYLRAALRSARVSCARAAHPAPVCVVLTTTMLDLYYHENESLPPIHIARSTMSASSEGGDILQGNATGCLPTISLTFKPAIQSKGPFEDEPSFEPATHSPMTASVYMMSNLRSDEPSPFSGKKSAHQSFTRHEGAQPDREEELIVPGTEEEMSDFTTNSIEMSSIHLDFNLPTLSLQLESKQLYEVIYNRINSDLLLWEPRVEDPLDVALHAGGYIYPAFGICKSAGYDSESDSTSSEEEDNLYYSTYDGKAKKGLGPSKPAPEQKDSHNFCLTLKVGDGLLTMYTPFRDGNKRVVPGQMGELSLQARALALCSVSGVRGARRTALLCLRAATAKLYHESSVTIPTEKPSLREYGTPLPLHLKKTIYPSCKGVSLKDTTTKKDIFSMALKVEPSSETPNLKTSCIALGFERCTLRHRGAAGGAWLLQLLDMLDVADYPVPGYAPGVLLSQLHVHVAELAVDYRPLYLPIRTVLTVGNFSFSSNLIPETNTSCLRFLVQDCALFISQLNLNKTDVVPQDEDKNPDLSKDYVCVLDVGLFELSLRMDEKINPGAAPRLELRASSSAAAGYACADSGTALCRLLAYAAAAADCAPPAPRAAAADDTLLGLEDRPIDEIRELSPSEIQQVNDLMAEAMKESPNATLDEDELNSSTEKEGVEIFFFPDESNMKLKTQQDSTEAADEIKPTDLECNVDIDHFKNDDDMKTEVEIGQEAKPLNAQVTKDLGDLTSTPKVSPKKSKRKKLRSTGDGSNTDDEYCIVETQPIADNDLDEPIVTWLGSGPVYMMDNHFTVPVARTDVLNAPKNFPNPILRYTLCEMSVTWHIFGGYDFRPPNNKESSSNKTVTIDCEPKHEAAGRRAKDYEAYDSRPITNTYKHGVSWSAGVDRVRPSSEQQTKDIKIRGGKYRDHDTCVKLCLSKVKFQHEVYPSGGTHASRQTLAISKIEVLDRLACSDINKLLSQYRMKDEPERKNAHMLVVKAVHLRPEPARGAQECCLKVSLLPLRFNVDQDTLAFLVGFFAKLGADDAGDEESKSESARGAGAGARQAARAPPPPVMSVGTPRPGASDVPRHDGPLMEPYEAERLVSENLIQLEEDFGRLRARTPPPAPPPPAAPLDDSPIYFRRVVFAPEVPLRLDYVGKRVELAAGPVAGLLLGLAQLNCSELSLKRLDYKLGLLGLEKLIQWALHEWLSDIKRHQLPGLLSGIGPMHSLLQLIQGVCDLVWLPVAQWRRDGRLVLGLRRGAASFSARTALAAVDLTTQLLRLVQACAETAFDMLSPSNAPALRPRAGRRSRRAPRDLRAAVAGAAATLSETVRGQRAWLARRERGAGVLRQLPAAAVAPLALAAGTAADVLGGVRAHLAADDAASH